MVGNASTVTEIRGGPLEHDGRAARHVTTDDVELPVELPDDRNVTFAVVIWRGDTNGNARFFSSADATTMAMFIRGQVYGNTIKQLTPQGWIAPDSPGSLPVPTQQWCFVAVSMDATAGSRRAYVIPLSNGAVADAGAFAATLGWDTSYRMGDELLYAARPVGGSAFFWLSDAFVVPRALDDADMLGLYDAARTSASFGTSGVLETTRVELNQEGGFTTTVEKVDGTSLETVRDASDAVVTTTTVQTNTEEASLPRSKRPTGRRWKPYGTPLTRSSRPRRSRTTSRAGLPQPSSKPMEVRWRRSRIRLVP